VLQRDEWIASMRHIAREGGCWVIDEEEWLCDGGALIVRPFGKVEAGPHNQDRTVLYCDIDPSVAPRSRRSLDVTGHYARSDIFPFT
jgi:nitrilase